MFHLQLLVSGKKSFLHCYNKYTGICFQSASSMQFLGVKKWCSANISSDTKQKHVCWKICKVRKVFGCAAGAYYFQCQVLLFSMLALRLSTRKSEIKKTLTMSTGTCGRI